MFSRWLSIVVFCSAVLCFSLSASDEGKLAEHTAFHHIAPILTQIMGLDHLLSDDPRVRDRVVVVADTFQVNLLHSQKLTITQLIHEYLYNFDDGFTKLLAAHDMLSTLGFEDKEWFINTESIRTTILEYADNTFGEYDFPTQACPPLFRLTSPSGQISTWWFTRHDYPLSLTVPLSVQQEILRSADANINEINGDRVVVSRPGSMTQRIKDDFLMTEKDKERLEWGVSDKRLDWFGQLPPLFQEFLEPVLMDLKIDLNLL
jgi:hypothetical protein